MLLIPVDPNIVQNQTSEVHIYSLYGDYISGNHNAGYAVFEKNTNSMLMDMAKVFGDAGLKNGSYMIVLNLFQNVWGGIGSEPVLVKEISPDRTEIHFKVNKSYLPQYGQFKTSIQSLNDNGILNNLVVNFGYNLVQKVVNIRFDTDSFYVKLYQPIYDEIEVKNKAWFQFELIDPYVDTIVLTQPLHKGNVTYMKGPNFDLDTSLFASNSTPFKNWEELLDANLPTQQRIIENTISGSGLVKLNIDFTDFNNFVFYSSAEERVRNFQYKITKIEEYSSSIAILMDSTASNTPFISSSVSINQQRIDQLTSTFDPFEKWMYFEPTSSIFSHDITGSITPYPKFLYSGSYRNYPLSSSIVTNWYNKLLYSSSRYDELNLNRLWWSVPEHIIMNPGNSDFVTFVEMVGHHFDTIYMYVNSLTKIHERDEHPQRGTPNQLLWSIAKSFGWQLQNTRQLADLWKYKQGTNQQGQYQYTGSMFSLSYENQTSQIWRRTVNNLPYLLKTKGTPRSVKALMSIYGIPQTLISIKEYGGPSPALDIPTLVEDRFIYKLRVTGSQYIELPRRVIPATSGSWGGVTRVPDSIVFRFNTEYSGSVSQSLWAIEDGTNRKRVLSNLELVHARAYTGTSSYSGSVAYGLLRYTQAQLSGSVYVSSSVTTGYLPLFDDDSWSVHLYTTQSILDTNKSGSIYLAVKKVSDSLYGRFSHSGSAVWSGSLNVAAAWGSLSGSANAPHYIILGGTTGSNSSRFTGNIDGYKEYFETLDEDTFNAHVLNPSSYQGTNDTSSYHTLFRYYPLGLDQQRWSHATYTQVSSSHPNRIASFDTTASFKGFIGTQTNQYDSANETHYIFPASIGGNVLRSEKIRLESGQLVRDLSPVARSEKGAYDKASFDTNRLAIVFAPNDQINNDIYNHSGYIELDDYIGDPSYEFEESYSELRRYSGLYYRKFQQRYDVNALVRLLALYDYTFFEQVKQVIPARADAILGVLIEDDLLNRSKVNITKRPTITNPQYDLNLSGLTPSQSGIVPVYDASASVSPVVESAYKYITGSIKFPIEISGSSVHHTGSRGNLKGIIDCVPYRYTGSQAPTQSIVDDIPLNCCYKKVIYHYSASGQFSTHYERQWYTAVSKSYHWYYSRSLECTGYQYKESCAVENRARFGGTRLEGAGININSPNTVDGGPVISVWEVTQNVLTVEDSPLGGKLIVR